MPLTPMLATEWAEAARVSAAGFGGVFLVLTLLYAVTTLYGAIARWAARRAETGANQKN